MQEIAYLFLKTVGLLGEVRQGIAAGVIICLYMFFREKPKTIDRVKIMRALSLIMEYMYLIMATHQNMHPEAKLPLNNFVRRIIEIGIPVQIAKDKDPE